MGPGLLMGLPSVGPPPQAVGMTMQQPLVGACFNCWEMGYWKNECPNVGGVDAREFFTCGWRRHICRDCPRLVRLAMQATKRNQDKTRME